MLCKLSKIVEYFQSNQLFSEPKLQMELSGLFIEKNNKNNLLKLTYS